MPVAALNSSAGSSAAERVEGRLAVGGVELGSAAGVAEAPGGAGERVDVAGPGIGAVMGG